MEYQNYEEYMQNVLGYFPRGYNIYENYDYVSGMPYNTYYRDDNTIFSLSEENANELYPEIYHLINPIVCKMCNENSQQITKELLEKMANDIYNEIEKNQTVVNVRIETTAQLERDKSNKNINETNMQRTEERRNNKSILDVKRTEERLTSKEPTENRSSENIKMRNMKNDMTASKEISENRGESRVQNSNLKDLIKILILKQLIGGGSNRPPVRPPFPGGTGNHTPRPPYPGGSGNRPPRPPFPGGAGNHPPRPPYPGGPGNQPPRPPYPRTLENAEEHLENIANSNIGIDSKLYEKYLQF